MPNIQPVKQCLSAIKRAIPKRKINPESLKYVPITEVKTTEAVGDTFVHTVAKAASKKKITDIDIWNFRSYMMSKKLDIKFTQEEIRKVFSFEGEEFEKNALGFLMKKLNIPENLTPEVMKMEVIKDCPMAYDMMLHRIYINPTAKIKDKVEYICLLRHELQHLLQNMQVFRSEGLGEEVIKVYAQRCAQIGKNNCDTYAKTLPVEQIQQMINADEETMNVFRELKKLLQEGKMQEYEQCMTKIENGTYTDVIQNFNVFRNNIIKEMGTIKKGLPEWKRAEKFLKENQQTYMKADGSVDWGEYVCDCRENEALIAQETMRLALLAEKEPVCYIRELNKQTKQVVENGFGNAQVNADMKNKAQEFKKNKITLKEMISYLFD